MRLERTNNSIRNIIWGILNRVVMLVFPFILRTVFIYSIGVDYLGLNSLFTSILTVLSMAELGFSSAVVYNMYKPIAEDNYKSICALLNFYKKVYYVIGTIVTVMGLIIIPFLPYLINGSYPSDINLVGLYILFLINTVCSYFLFAYKICILTAYQREDVLSKINIVLKIVMYVAQGILLLVFKNYYGYVVATIINTILTNVLSAYYSNKLYPQYKCEGKISEEDRKLLTKNIKGLMIGKVCLVSRNAFDNIYLSMFIGLTAVTIYGNYYYIMNAISGMLIILMTSIGAGIGNSIATESVKKNHHDFKKLSFMYSWIAGWCTVCLFCLYQPFMTLWMGKDLLFPMIDVVLICMYFYSLSMGDVRSQYSTASGLFWENRWYILAEAISNIILNYFLGKYFGVHGIILATWITIFFINFGWGSSILFKYYFKDFSLKRYFLKHIFYLTNVTINVLLTYFVCCLIKSDSIFTFLIKIIICLILPNIYFYVVYNRTEEFKESVLFVKNSIIPKIKSGGYV